MLYRMLSPPQINCPRSERFWCPVGVVMCLGSRVQIRIETVTDFDREAPTDLIHLYSWSPAAMLRVRPIGDNFYLYYPEMWLSPRAMGLSSGGRITGFLIDMHHIRGQSYALY